MQMTKMPGRLYPSPVWRVKGNFGVGGDSGAWVIDNATGGVCGHVTAYSEFWEYATIAPMEVLLHDMEDMLGASVSLPDSDDAAVLSFQQQIVDIKPNLQQDGANISKVDRESEGRLTMCAGRGRRRGRCHAVYGQEDEP